MTTVFLVAVFVIVALAVLDLWVGVTNDAVNFINSAVGARIATRRRILVVASAGVLFGALFSSGMMEVARKGVFDPGMFLDETGTLNIAAILMVYLGVMAADVVMLDLFNTFGLPTSTTVSIVSELVGASLAVSFWMSGGSLSEAWGVIHSGPVLRIYTGIFLSILIAFFSAAVVMFLLRLLFTQDLARTFPYVGWLWTGLSFSSLSYFVLFKGLKHATFIGPEVRQALVANIWTILIGVFVLSALAAGIFARHHRVIFRAIILAGTGALGLAFAGNDLVNFIGPTVAAGQAVFVEGVNLSGKVPTPGWALLIAGAIMVLALWSSNKAKTVTDTEVRLASGGKMKQRFGSTLFARLLVRFFQVLFTVARILAPRSLRNSAHRRTDPAPVWVEDAPPYDLLRASVNLTIASIIISAGTAMKLPLSTTYITFMVAMGASLADRTWDPDSAPSRVTGMLAVVGGWLLTGFIASAAAFVMASVLHLLGLRIGLMVVTALVIVWLVAMAAYHRKMFGGRETVVDSVEAAPGRMPARNVSGI